MDTRDVLPKRVVVSRVLSGRYAPGSRPLSWDLRKEGVESVVTTDGDTIKLYSNGGQSTPSKDWQLLLTNEYPVEEGKAYSWTLYGVGSSTAAS